MEIFNDLDGAKLSEIIEQIETLLDAYRMENDLDSFTTCTQQQFYGGLMFVCFNLFDTDKTLLHKYTPTGRTNGHITDMYNDSIIYGLCKYYIYLCSKYNKVANPIGFSYLSGIDLDTLKRWESMESQRPQAYGTIKSLRKAYESGLENGAQSGRNPVGYIATLNHRFGWSNDSRQTLTVNITRSQEQILQSFDSGLIEENPANADK